MSEQEFLSELKELLKKHPEEAKKVFVEETIEQPAGARSSNEGCKRWGINPETGERICIEDYQSRARASGAPRTASRARPRRGKPNTRDTGGNKT